LFDPYASGIECDIDVPHSITGSKQHWKSFGLDLVFMTQQMSIPDFFLTLSSNNNWPGLTYSQPSGKDEVPVLILLS